MAKYIKNGRKIYNIPCDKLGSKVKPKQKKLGNYIFMFHILLSVSLNSVEINLSYII